MYRMWTHSVLSASEDDAAWALARCLAFPPPSVFSSQIIINIHGIILFEKDFGGITYFYIVVL